MPNVFFDWSVPLKNIPLFISGAEMTLLLTVITCFFETVLGLIFGYIRFRKRPKVLFGAVTVYVEFFRNTPLLVQIFFIFYGLPAVGIVLNGFWAGTLALIVCHTAYTTEVFRSGIQSVNRGQWEAAQCIGLSRVSAFIDVIMPQTLRAIFPALSNQFIMTMLSSSLVSALNVNELTNVTIITASSTFRVTENYTFAILIYYVLTLTLSFFMKYVNHRYFPSVSSKGE